MDNGRSDRQPAPLAQDVADESSGSVAAWLAVLRQHLSTAVDHQEGIALVDVQGLLLDHNRRLPELLGYSEDRDLRQRSMADLVRRSSRETAGGLAAAGSRAVHELSIPVYEVTVPGTPERVLLVRSAPLFIQPQQQWGRLWVLTDITHERQLQEHHAHSEKARVNVQLAGGVAHEINNALTSVLGNLELSRLLDETSRRQHPQPATPGPLVDYLRAAEEGARRIHRLVRDLLEFGNRPQAVLRPGSVQAALQRVYETLQQEAVPGVQLQLDPGGPLWQCRFDESALQQALLMLCRSACRDLQRSGGSLLLAAANHTDPADGSQWVRLSVTDRSERELSQGRRTGYHGAAAVDMYGGTLALSVAMVNVVIQEMRGLLEVVQQPPDSREVRLLLPRSDRLPADAGRGQTAPLRVLVVDDDATILNVCGNMLTLCGHQVRCAASGQEALSILQSGNPFDVILLDEAMPGMSGQETLTELRHRQIRTPVIIFTGRPVEEQFFSAAGDPTGFLPKPFRMQDLKNCLEPFARRTP